MKKHNVGRISAIIVILNVLFLLIYLTDRNGGTEPETVITVSEEEIIKDIQILKDETVSDDYIQLLSDVIKSHYFNASELASINTYEWYITDNPNNTTTFEILDDCITVFADHEQFRFYCEIILSKIVGKGDVRV